MTVNGGGRAFEWCNGGGVGMEIAEMSVCDFTISRTNFHNTSDAGIEL
jgi:hypothetical protein